MYKSLTLLTLFVDFKNNFLAIITTEIICLEFMFNRY